VIKELSLDNMYIANITDDAHWTWIWINICKLHLMILIAVSKHL